MAAEEHLPEREAQVARLLKAAAQSERAPAALRAEVDSMRSKATRRRRRGSPQSRARPAVGLLSFALPAVAAVVVALVLTVGAGAGAPSIAQAASVAAHGPVAMAPGPDPSAPTTLLNVRVGDLQFPNWQASGGWHSFGKRQDTVGNRTITTVYYKNGSHRIAYSIVSAPTLSGLETHGEPYATFTQHGRTVIVWEERNHTCVLSAVGIPAYELWHLAVIATAKQAA
jgi:hypothetical protein